VTRFAAALFLLVTSTPGSTEGPAQSSWAFVKGEPSDGCIGPDSINVPPDFTVIAVSEDRRVSWAITVGPQGLDSIACSNSHSSVNGTWGPVRSHVVELAKKQLIEANDALVADTALKFDGPTRDQYRLELTAKLPHIDQSLRMMLKAEKRLNPKFLKQQPQLNVPVY